MSTVDPQASRFHAEVAALAKRVSDHVIPKTRAYHEIWYGDERVASSAPEELFYGRTYMPRKFKIGFALPPSNDIDVYAQDHAAHQIGLKDKPVLPLEKDARKGPLPVARQETTLTGIRRSGRSAAW